MTEKHQEQEASLELAQQWRCGSHVLNLEKPLIMGILNVTPDSFSDGGEHNEFEAACAYAREMLEQGATIIDVGGESTRPGSDEVSLEEELRRVEPVVRQLAKEGVVVSIDTRHAEVALVCVEAGASIINDVSGFRDPAMQAVAASCDAGLVIMHMQGEPKTMQDSPHYEDVVQEVADYLVGQAALLQEQGVDPKRICIDPGAGFGKTARQSQDLVAAASRLAKLGYPLMVAVSRKSFVGALSGEDDPQKRDSASATIAAAVARRGARVLRVHNVPATVQALEWLEKVKAAEEREEQGEGAELEQLPPAKPHSKGAAKSPAKVSAAKAGTAKTGARGTSAGKAGVEDAHPQDEAVARKAYLSLGSNLGKSKDILLKAMGSVIALEGVELVKASSIYETEPAYYTEQGNFQNAALTISTTLEPIDLLHQLQLIEISFGRQRSFPNAPRTLDIDILDFEGVVSDDPEILLPHPLLLQRDFAVSPLLEISPEHVLANGVVVTRDEIVCGKVLGSQPWYRVMAQSIHDKTMSITYDPEIKETGAQ